MSFGLHTWFAWAEENNMHGLSKDIYLNKDKEPQYVVSPEEQNVKQGEEIETRDG